MRTTTKSIKEIDSHRSQMAIKNSDELSLRKKKIIAGSGRFNEISKRAICIGNFQSIATILQSIDEVKPIVPTPPIPSIQPPVEPAEPQPPMPIRPPERIPGTPEPSAPPVPGPLVPPLPVPSVPPVPEVPPVPTAGY